MKPLSDTIRRLCQLKAWRSGWGGGLELLARSPDSKEGGEGGTDRRPELETDDWQRWSRSSLSAGENDFASDMRGESEVVTEEEGTRAEGRVVVEGREVGRANRRRARCSAGRDDDSEND